MNVGDTPTSLPSLPFTMTLPLLRPLAGLGALLVSTSAATLVAMPRPAGAQQNCFQVAAFVAPNPLRCQQIGQDYLGRPIWLCC